MKKFFSQPLDHIHLCYEMLMFHGVQHMKNDFFTSFYGVFIGSKLVAFSVHNSFMENMAYKTIISEWHVSD